MAMDLSALTLYCTCDSCISKGYGRISRTQLNYVGKNGLFDPGVRPNGAIFQCPGCNCKYLVEEKMLTSGYIMRNLTKK